MNPELVLQDTAAFIRDYWLIARSRLFDRAWYLARNPDVARSRMNPIMHYLRHGASEGRDPGPDFSTTGYLDQRPFAVMSRMNPLAHYLLHKNDSDFDLSEQEERDQTDIEWTKRYSRLIFNRPLDLKHPKSFNEKISVYKLLYRERPLWQYADKYEARVYFRETVGEEHLVPLIGIYNTPDEILFDALPGRFMLKATHGCGMNIFCLDKRQLDWADCKRQMSDWLGINYYDPYREWAYREIQPRIIIEELLTDATGVSAKDYKIFCFNGRPRIIQVISSRFTGKKTLQNFDLNWKKLPMDTITPRPDVDEQKPEKLQELIDVAAALCQGFPFVRVDLYCTDRVYCGEMTFYPGAGLSPFRQYTWDRRFGRLLDIKNLISLYNE